MVFTWLKSEAILIRFAEEICAILEMLLVGAEQATHHPGMRFMLGAVNVGEHGGG